MSASTHTREQLRRSEETRIHPPRVMGFADLLLFYVVSQVSLRWIATAAAAGPSSIVIWLGMLLCLYIPLALSVMELSSRYPQEGGLYVWTKHAFGEFAGYISAWSYWTSNLSYFPAILYFAASNALYIWVRHWHHFSQTASYHVWFSIIALSVIALMNVVGLNVGKWLHNISGVATLLPVLIIIIMGVISWSRFGPATHFDRISLTPSVHLRTMMFWASLGYALTGCETGSFLGGEIRDARRTLPRALVAAGLIVTFCYIAGTVGLLVAVPTNEISGLQGLMQGISRLAANTGWYGAIPVTAALITISAIGGAGAYLVACARLPFVLGIDRFLPPVFGKLHSRWGTPYVALMFQFLCGTLFVFFGQAGTSVEGAYDVMVSMGIITYFIPYLFLFGAIFTVQREKAGPEVIQIPGRRPVAILLSVIGFATTLLAIVMALMPPPDEVNKILASVKLVGLTVILLALGTVLFYMARKRGKNVNGENHLHERV